jgi:hypothetical protein
MDEVSFLAAFKAGVEALKALNEPIHELSLAQYKEFRGMICAAYGSGEIRADEAYAATLYLLHATPLTVRQSPDL